MSPIRLIGLDAQVKFYQDFFDTTPDFSGVAIPATVYDHPQALYIMKGLTYEKVWIACLWLFGGKYHDNPNRQFSLSAYDDLSINNAISRKDQRKTDEAYAVHIKNSLYADYIEDEEVLLDILHDDGPQTMTLLERLVYGMMAYWECKELLDLNGAPTLCLGSNIEYLVPYVSCNNFTSKEMGEESKYRLEMAKIDYLEHIESSVADDPELRQSSIMDIEPDNFDGLPDDCGVQVVAEFGWDELMQSEVHVRTVIS